MLFFEKNGYTKEDKDRIISNMRRIVVLTVLVVVAVVTFCLVSLYSIFSGIKETNKNTESSVPDKKEDTQVTTSPDNIMGGEDIEYIPVGDINIPECGDITYSLSTKKSDFFFENPAENSCFLKVSIIRLDTKESIYSSTQISPGKGIGAVSFSPNITSGGTYPVMIKVDAYALDRFLHLNSLKIEPRTVTAY